MIDNSLFCRIRSIIKNCRGGFSLAEVMVVSGLVAGIALVIMRVSSQQAKLQVRTESDMQISSMVATITQTLLNGDSCLATIGPMASISGTPTVPKIVVHRPPAAPKDVYVSGNTYNKVKVVTSLKGATTTPPGFGEVTLVAKFTRSSKENAYGGQTIEKLFPLRVEVNAANKVTKCYSLVENAVDTSMQNSCTAIGGVLDSSNRCVMVGISGPVNNVSAVSTQYLSDYTASILDSRYVNISGDTMTGALTVNNTILGANIVSAGNISATTGNITTTSGNISTSGGTISGKNVVATNQLVAGATVCVGTKCRDFSEKSCAPGEVVWKVGTDGSVMCRNITCPANQYFAGLSSAGVTLCRPYPTQTCPTNQYVSKVYSNGTVDCSSLPATLAIPSGGTDMYIKSVSSTGIATYSPDKNVFSTTCGNGLYLTGYSSTGTPICHSLGNCGAGKFLQGFDSSGSPVCISLPNCGTGLVLQGFNTSGTAICVTASAGPTLYNCDSVYVPSSTSCTPSIGGSCLYYIYSRNTCVGLKTSSSCSYTKSTYKTSSTIDTSGSFSGPVVSTSFVSSTNVSATCPKAN